MMGAQVRMANTLEQFYDESTPIGPAYQRYKDAVIKMETQACDEVVRFFFIFILDTYGRHQMKNSTRSVFYSLLTATIS